VTETFDFIIVGAGSAGCVLANRLSKDPSNEVLLLEAGGKDSSTMIHMPSALWLLVKCPRFNWGYESEPQPRLLNRRIATPRVKVLGGSSSINGMMFVRGNPLDYDNWVELGATRWSYPQVLPYFKRMECFAEGGDAYRGDSGELKVRKASSPNPLYAAFIQAGVEAGYLRTSDLNGYQQDGFGQCDMSIGNQRRWSTAKGYLHSLGRRDNLKIVLRAHVTHVEVEGNRAGGVVYQLDGHDVVAKASREVVISAGAINTPQILKLSGIGPGAELQSLGIVVKNERPGVGENLTDHTGVRISHECLAPVSLHPKLTLVGKAIIGMQWLMFKTGLGGSNQLEASAFIRSRSRLQWPDLQLDFTPLALSESDELEPVPHGFQTHFGPVRPKSRGHVTLRSRDSRDPPFIQYDYFDHDEDWEVMRAGMRLTREIHRQPAFDRFRGRELSPGEDVRSNTEIDDFIRRTTKTVYHPISTCRMGTDLMAVVDSQCRVHGAEGLRVVDASVMPQITTGNTNAPVIMIAEKAADMILGQPPLAVDEADYFVAPDWETRQRPGEAVRTIGSTGDDNH